LPRNDHFEDITVSGTVSLGAQSTIEGNLAPDNDDNRTLGTATKRWQTIYLVNNLPDVSDPNVDTLDFDNANQDVRLSRASANVLQLATGDSFIPQTNGQNLGSAAAGWDLHSRRIRADAGTSLVSGDFALSAGWGASGAIGTLTGTDNRFRATITANGAGPAANPTIVLTFKDGTWTTAPFAVVSRGGGSQPTVQFEVTTVTATALTLTFQGTPVGAETYIFSVICVG